MNSRHSAKRDSGWGLGWLYVALAGVALGWASPAWAQSVTLSFVPWQVVRGEASTLTAVASGGTAPYTYQYQTRPAGSSTWTASAMAGETNTSAWTSNMQARVRVVDAAHATSEWSAAAALVVAQPLATLTFTPSVVTQSQSSVLAAGVTNGTEPYTYTYQYRWGGTGTWKSSTLTAAGLTNVFKSSIAYRMRSVDANHVTSEWAEAMLTVLPSAISASLSFSSSNVVRGEPSTLTASVADGTAPYTYAYQWRWGGTTNWNAAKFTAAATTYAWASNIEFRVRAVDSFNATSAWSEAAALTVAQPAATLVFSPSTVTQSQESVLSASVTNGTEPYAWTYQWRWTGATNWSSSTLTAAGVTNTWKSSIDYRVRSVDANHVTSAWSEATTLTVLPSAISASLSFSTSNVLRGVQSTLTAVPTNGTAPYTLAYQWRWGGATDWNAAKITVAETTYAWASNIEFRVRAVDSFSSTSAWSEAAALTVAQPLATVAFSPATVTQSLESVVSASVTNATGPVAWQWQKKVGATWTGVADVGEAITNVWPTTVEYRARSVDANGVTSEWASATLTVLPSAIAAGVSFAPTQVLRGVQSTLTAAASNGTAPYAYSYQWRWSGTTNWTAARFTAAETTYAWASNIDFRVRAVDGFSSTSEWSEAATLTVAQPLATVSFSPSTVTQSQESVVSAVATNVTGPVTWQWQKKVGAAWSNVVGADEAITNVWPFDVEYRARCVDANNVTSEWSAAGALTVLPSAIAAGLSFAPTQVLRGVESVLTATATAGTEPYRYAYEWRLVGTEEWTTTDASEATFTNRWAASVEYRAKAIDSFNSTSAWTSATLTVVQPLVSVSFSPATVTQSQSSVVSAVATNVTGPVTFEWQKLVEGAWTNVEGVTDAAITNVWPFDIEYRARSVDANSVTSEWSAAATLTVKPSAIAMSLAFAPTNMLRGLQSVLSMSASNGTPPYAYFHQWRYAPAGEWSVRGPIEPGVTNAWDGSVDYRVQVVDSFLSTSAWAQASLTVVQPAVTVAFSPSVVTQSRPSVVSAVVTNATLPVAWQWQKKVGSVWTNVDDTASSISNTWPSTIEYRARSVDANNVTSGWASATLTVLPSAISAGLAFAPSNVLRGVASVMTTTPTNGYDTYRYVYEWKATGSVDWAASSFDARVVTNAWESSVDFRVKVIDGFNATSAWSAVRTLVVRQPAVTVTFAPTQVVQRLPSVVSAVVTNATLPVAWQWQKDDGSGWTDVTNDTASISNVWPATVSYRARSVDANSVTSEWSAAKTLTVLPSAIAASLAFAPSNVVRGVASVLTATPTNGYGACAFQYEWRLTGTVDWAAAADTGAQISNRWDSSVEYRVKAVDSFNSTSAWSAAKTLVVAQPAVTVTFSPTQVVQRLPSVVTAAVVNATAPVVWEWQQLDGTNWIGVTNTASSISNVWPATVSYRARSIDANSVTSEWSAAKTLTVLPSAIAASLAFAPSNVIRGVSSVLTATPTNGYGACTFQYEWRLTGTVDWAAAADTGAQISNQWESSVEYRVKAVDSFNSTSAWSAAKTLVVRQPAVTITFLPTTVTQSRSSVVSAVVTNATGPITWEWQKDDGSGWTNTSDTAATFTNYWPATVSYRARSIDANSVTSEWSAAKTLTVLPNLSIAASLAFAPTNVIRGVDSVLTATPTNGYGAYTFQYEWRLTGTVDWVSATDTTAQITNQWDSSVEYRVKAVDSFNATSAWSAAKTLTVVQATVALAFAPTQVVHGVSSVLRATVTNASGPCTFLYETRAKGETNWTASPLVDAVTTNEWRSSVDYRACAVVNGSYTSQWSNVATLTVLPPNLRVSLALSTNEVEFGAQVVVTSTPTNGSGTYAYEYQSKDITAPGSPWVAEPGLTTAVATNRWFNHILLQVRVRDAASTNLSYWSDPVVLLVWPAADADVLEMSLPIVSFSVQPGLAVAGAERSADAKDGTVTLTWKGSSGKEYAIGHAASLTSEWTEYPVRFTGGVETTSGTIPWDGSAPLGFFRIREYD